MSNVATRNDVRGAVRVMTIRLGPAAALIVGAVGALVSLKQPASAPFMLVNAAIVGYDE